MRAYAGSLAATANHADTDRAMRRVLDYYLYTATTADAHIPTWEHPTVTSTPTMPAHHPGLDTPQRARAWLDTELVTLVTCLDHATAHPDLVIALAATLHNYLRFTGAWDQADRIHHTALAAAERTHDRPRQATILTNLGHMYRVRGDYARAQQVLDQAHQLFIDLGDRLGQATTFGILGYVYHLRGDWERAQQLLEQAHQLFTNLDDRLGQAVTLVNSGIAYRLWGDWERAQQLLEQALQLFTDLGNRRGQGNALNYLGHVYYLRGDYERAQQLLEQAHQLFTDPDFDGPRGVANAVLNLGRVHHRIGDYGQALDLLTQAYALYTDLGDRDGQAEALNSMGDLALDHSPAGDPHALFVQARALARTIGAALYEARALVGLGCCARRAHDVPTATTAFIQALTIYQRLGSPEAATITGYLADLHDDPDQHAEPK